MKAGKIRVRIFTVVHVWRGIPVAAKSFGCLAEARSCVQRLQGCGNLLDNDVQLFVSVLTLPSRKRRTGTNGNRNMKSKRLGKARPSPTIRRIFEEEGGGDRIRRAQLYRL